MIMYFTEDGQELIGAEPGDEITQAYWVGEPIVGEYRQQGENWECVFPEEKASGRIHYICGSRRIPRKENRKMSAVL
jgi:hypothetical protein